MATQVTVSGTIVDGSGVGCSGTVTFTPSQPLYDTDGSQIVGTVPVVATLTSGAFSVAVYATDDANTSPDGATYTIEENLTNSAGTRQVGRGKYRAEIPAADTTLRYEDITEAVPAAQNTVSYATSASVSAITGSLTPTAVTYTSGNIALAATGLGTWADIESAGSASARPSDLVFTGCSAGQWLELHFSGQYSAAGVGVAVDAATVVSGSVATANLSGQSLLGYPSWGVQSTQTGVENADGSIVYQLTADDIDDGAVRVRMRYSIASSTRTLNGTAANPWRFRGRGPFD